MQMIIYILSNELSMCIKKCKSLENLVINVTFANIADLKKCMVYNYIILYKKTLYIIYT